MNTVRKYETFVKQENNVVDKIVTKANNPATAREILEKMYGKDSIVSIIKLIA